MADSPVALAIKPPELDIMTLGQILAKSGFFTDVREAGQAIVKILAGQELGFGPVASMTGIYIVKGRVTLSANMIASLIKRSGVYDYRVKKLTDQECLIEFYERGQVVGQSEFDVADAAKANLAKGDNWQAFPRNMLFARAMSNGAKWFCAGIFGGPLYTPDELGAQVIVDEAGGMDVRVPDEEKSVIPPPSSAVDRESGEIVTSIPAPSKPPICGDCVKVGRSNAEITAWTSPKGTAFTARQMADASMERFGEPLCREHGAARKEIEAANAAK